MKRSVAIIAFCVSVAGCDAWIQIKGTVQNQRGAPVRQAEVNLTNLDASEGAAGKSKTESVSDSGSLLVTNWY